MAQKNHLSYSNNQVAEINGCVNTESLFLEWAGIPWDTASMGYPVIQINRLEVYGASADRDMVAFETARDQVRCKLVSCRLESNNLRESMFLEDHGFRFIEMLYKPEFANLQNQTNLHCSGLAATPACNDDMPAIMEITGNAFNNERFHVDPRLSPQLGNLRYCNWAKTSLTHSKQQLYVVREGNLLVAFFITEHFPDGTCYWHLNAVFPHLQGQGYGRRSWLTMLELARIQGMQRVRTSITARNYRVLNLYSSLGFRFPSPMMTFHWVRMP